MLLFVYICVTVGDMLLFVYTLKAKSSHVS